MKYTIKHYEFIDKKFLPIFGIKSICDFQTIISYNDLSKNADFLANINSIIPELKKLFTVREFNLHKYDNKIKTIQQSIGIFKKCLQLLNINFTIETRKNVKYMRLTEKNILLGKYIEMSDFRDFDIESKILAIKQKSVITQQEVYKNIKKNPIIRKFSFDLNDNDEYLCIDLNPLYTNLSISSIVFDLLVDTKFDEYIVQNTTFDMIDIIISNKQLCQIKYSNNINILPQGLLLLPINITPYSSYTIKLKYARNYKPIIGNISKSVTLEMKITEINFKKQFKFDNLQQNINFDFDQTIFYTEQGICHFCSKSNHPNINMDDFECEPYIYEEYNGVLVKENEFYDGAKCLVVLGCSPNKYDFTAELFSNTLLQFSHEVCDDCEIYKCVINRISDLIIIDNLTIHTTSTDKVHTNVSEIFIISHRNNDEFKINAEFDINTNDNNTFYISIKNPLKINLIGALSGCFLYVRTTKNTKINRFIISGTALYFETIIRREYCKTINNVIANE